jgi:glycosyltransferase involved in cell wall biosynthesis
VSLLFDGPISAISIKDSTPKRAGIDGVTISIVVPVSPNSGSINLTKLLDSVYEQNFPSVEVLILSEDASKWNSVCDDENGSEVRIKRLLVPQGTGASAARNLGAVNASGNILAFLDDDVILGKRWFERCVTALTDSSVGAVTGRVLVRLEEYGLDFVPESLKWVVGGTYWDSKVPISVFSAAGMNFCIKKEVFLKAGGYNENLGPKGDRPETARWHRLGAEESDLAIRVWLRTGLKVVYDPNLIVEHRLRRESILLRGLVRRALHVGHNRAYIHSIYPRLGVVNDNQTFQRLVRELTFTAKKFLQHPVRVWQGFSFTFLVVVAFGAGFLEGLLHYKHHLSIIDK